MPIVPLSQCARERGLQHSSVTDSYSDDVNRELLAYNQWNATHQSESYIAISNTTNNNHKSAIKYIKHTFQINDVTKYY